MKTQIVELEIVEGVEGPSVYLDGYRIAGPKPWGGGHISRRWSVDLADLAEVIARAAPPPKARKQRARKIALAKGTP